MKTLQQSVLLFLGLTVVTGVVYPLAMTGVAQVVFPYQANGSLIERDGNFIGSELIGQHCNDPHYFWGRPSAVGYNGAASAGSNFGPTNPVQLDAVKARAENIRIAHPNQSGRIPVELVTASGSGLDPHISPAAAEFQVERVSIARSLDATKVRELISQHTQGRAFGVLGEPRVNVLTLNVAMDDLQSK